MDATDLGSLVQAILFFLFADLTALLAAVIGPTYDQLLVPDLSPQALFPSLHGPASSSSNFLLPAVHFSSFLVTSVVDPLVALLALGVAVLYLARATLGRWATRLEGMLPRLVLAVVAANFTVPLAGVILGLAGGLYPVIAGWDGGAWHHWVNLGGYGELRLSWDNGALAFVLALAEFLAVFGLLLAVGIRDALLAVLIVVLPVLTLLWPFRPLSPLPRRAWLLFGELAFLPCVLVIPLELAVGSSSPVLLLGFLGAALAAPFLLSTAGVQLSAIGFPTGAGTVQAGAQRGLAVAPAAATAIALPVSGSLRGAGTAGRAAHGALRVAGTATAPLAAPLAVHELLGHAALGLARHWGRRTAPVPPRPRLPGPGRGG